MNYPSIVAAALLVFLFPSVSAAAILYSQDVTLAPGWNIVSTPKVLDSHSFSVAETSENFDVFVLDPGSSSGWATMADLGQTEFAPLYGYFVNNKTATTQTLTFNYKDTTQPNERLFSRTFSTTGWHSIGVANASYALDIGAATTTDTNNQSPILNALVIANEAGQALFDQLIDFTSGLSAVDIRSTAISDSWDAAVVSELSNLNDFRETKGYAVYITQANALYSGFQNNEIPTPEPEPEPEPDPVPDIVAELVSVSEEVVFEGDTSGQKQVGEFTIVIDITAIGSDIYIDKSTTRTGTIGAASGEGTAGDGFIYGTTTESTIGSSTISSVVVASGAVAGDSSGVFKIPEGATRRFTLTISSEAQNDGVMAWQLYGINWDTESSDTTPDEFYTSNMSDFKTDLLTLLII